MGTGPPAAEMTALLSRAAIGLLAAIAVAIAAYRARSLSRSGAVAAVVVGTAAVAAGWAWAALLMLYFIVSSALSRVGAGEKERRTHGVVAKGGQRDAVQVVANGGVFALCTLATLVAGTDAAPTLAAAAAGALAAATADTWATEVGTLVGGTPRALFSFTEVPPGTSGALSVAGTAAMLAGALFVALTAQLLGVTDALARVAIAGTAAALADSVLGAMLQERRWCDTCARATERSVHDCGTVTRQVGGMPGVDNDAVNLVSTIIGAVTAALLGFRG
jgi:uncharacterized protein (TIGR00297 family)